MFPFLFTFLQASVKLYPKFTHKSIKTMWEQHDVTETEISPEVYVRLAEDLSYRMMEISNVCKQIQSLMNCCLTNV